MSDVLYKLSDAQKENGLWNLLNSETDEDGYIHVRYCICAVYDDYALAFDCDDNGYVRAYYTKDDEKDSLEITSISKCFVIDVTEDEYTALRALRSMNNNTYEHIDEVFSANTAKVEELNTSLETKNTELETLGTKNAELETALSTLKVERDDLSASLEQANAAQAQTQETLTQVQSSFAQAQSDIETLTQEKTELLAYKKNVEDNAKLAVIDSYSDSLSEETLNKYRNELDSYTCEDLDMRLTYEQKRTNPNMFKQTQAFPTVILKPEATGKGAIESILDHYENK